MITTGPGLVIFAGGSLPILRRLFWWPKLNSARASFTRRGADATALLFLVLAAVTNFACSQPWIPIAFLFAYALVMCFGYQSNAVSLTWSETLFDAILPGAVFVIIYLARM